MDVSSDQTSQNETPLAINPLNPQNLITGNNDWNYNDGCGVKHAGPSAWTGFAPPQPFNLEVDYATVTP